MRRIDKRSSRLETEHQNTSADWQILAWCDRKIAKWWMPEAVEFIDALPHTAMGKVQKVALREMYKDYVFPA